MINFISVLVRQARRLALWVDHADVYDTALRHVVVTGYRCLTSLKIAEMISDNTLLYSKRSDRILT